MQCNISLCMIVRNEEEFLGRCLMSIRGAADEIIVVDTGSTDSTVDVARRYGAKVLSHTWQNDFSEARNVSLDSATGRWILVLDADEELTDEARKGIVEVVDADQVDAVEMVVRSEMPETDILRYEDTRIVRFFRNKREYRYSMPVHEQMRSSIERSGGVIARSDLLILHHGYSRKNVQGKDSRAERNLGVLKCALSQFPDNAYFHYQTGVTLMSAGRKDEAYDEMKKVLELDHAGMGQEILDRFFMKLSQLSLEKNENQAAVDFALRSLEYNSANGISMYVVAIGLLSMNRINEGYQMLLKIRNNPGVNLRLDAQLEHLIKACRELLKIR